MPLTSDGMRDAGGLFRRFGRQEDGATALEFAIVSPVFLGLLFGILELALTFWSTQVRETAVANAARQIYTGAFQTSASNADTTVALVNFKKSVCDNVAAMFNCQKLVKVDVQRYTSASSATITVPIRNGAFDASSFGYNPPGSNEICVVRAAMEYPVYVNLIGYKTGLTSGNRLIMASAAFRTEPY